VECAAQDRDRAAGRAGEAIDEVAREIQVPVHEVEEWRRVFLEGGQQGLKRHGLDPEEREASPPAGKDGNMTMRLELQNTSRKKGVRGGRAEAAE